MSGFNNMGHAYRNYNVFALIEQCKSSHRHMSHKMIFFSSLETIDNIGRAWFMKAAISQPLFPSLFFSEKCFPRSFSSIKED